jgi:uncharacterized protein (DUF427 family)
MAKATWKGVVIAQSDECETVDGNAYFPRASLLEAHFKPSTKTTVCGWKGTANYLDVVVGDDVKVAAAWYYADPKPAAENIRDHVAFWGGVVVER